MSLRESTECLRSNLLRLLVASKCMITNIKDKLQRINKDHLKLLSDIGIVAENSDLKAYLVGGMIRDILLGYDNLDIDIVVENNAQALAEALVKKFPNCELSAKHDKFHTAKVIFNINGNKIPVDLASTREEIYKHPAALPTVSISDLKNDLIRRDFTINALAVSILPHDFGEVVDLFHGLDDLKDKKIRILHDLSFIDDPTRMIRAVRFAVKLGFEIESKTKKLLEQAVNSGDFDNLIQKIRGDRVRIEIRYLFNLTNIKNAVNMLIDTKIFNLISIDLNFAVMDELWNATKYIPGKHENLWLIYSALFMRNLDDEKKLNIMKNLQLSGNEISIVCKGFEAYNSLINSQKTDSVSVYKILRDLSKESLILTESLAVNDKILPFIQEYLERTSKIKLEITGQDLIAMGIKEGKQLGDILNKILEIKINKPLMKKDSEIEEAKKLLKD